MAVIKDLKMTYNRHFANGKELILGAICNQFIHALVQGKIG